MEINTEQDKSHYQAELISLGNQLDQAKVQVELLTRAVLERRAILAYIELKEQEVARKVAEEAKKPKDK